MSSKHLTVVISQAQGKNPAKRKLEEALTAALLQEPGLDVAIVPYLYDLDAAHTARLFLESVVGDMVVLAWMFPRAAFWLLDRDNIKGHFGETQLKPPSAEVDGEEGEALKGIGAVAVPDRRIYCLDLRDYAGHEPYVDEIRRIAAECRKKDGGRRTEGGGQGTVSPPSARHPPSVALSPLPARRWYPVIDYSRCTNCMECIDFCLFSVYGVDVHDRIIVEEQDNCKKGCPACSRVCPEQAIMFPDHKTPAIAGAPAGAISSLKIDLSRVFGGSDVMAIAAQERDRELVRDGREVVRAPKRQANKDTQSKDDLDNLIDKLDSLI